MNRKETLKAHVISMCVKKKMTVKEGANRLGLSERQVKNLKARYKEKGVSSMLHGNCGRQPKHTLTLEIKERILQIKNEPYYQNVNFSHFHEDLDEVYGIRISYSALRMLLLAEGYKSPKTHRGSKIEHKRRERKDQFGEMLQADATPFAWFGGQERYALHAMIDDATGNITGLYMSKNECAEGYFRVLKQTISSCGIPLSIYADGLSLFFSAKKPTIEEQLEGKQYGATQFDDITKQLGSRLIHARSPQAKGRVERLWETLQSRLPLEFARRNITDVSKANAFLQDEYIARFNTRFGIEPNNRNSAFMPRPKGINIDSLLSIRYTRTVDNSGCFSLDSILCQCNVPGILPKSKIDILINQRLGVKVFYKGSLFTPIPILDKKKRQVTGSSINTIIAQFVSDNCLKNEHIS